MIDVFEVVDIEVDVLGLEGFFFWQGVKLDFSLCFFGLGLDGRQEHN